MIILGLYNNECAVELFDWLEEQGNTVIRTGEKISIDSLHKTENAHACTWGGGG